MRDCITTRIWCNLITFAFEKLEKRKDYEKHKKSSEVRNDSLLIVLSDGEFELNETLLCNTLFIISDKKNIRKFEKDGKVIQFNL